MKFRFVDGRDVNFVLFEFFQDHSCCPVNRAKVSAHHFQCVAPYFIAPRFVGEKFTGHLYKRNWIAHLNGAAIFDKLARDEKTAQGPPEIQSQFPQVSPPPHADRVNWFAYRREGVDE